MSSPGSKGQTKDRSKARAEPKPTSSDRKTSKSKSKISSSSAQKVPNKAPSDNAIFRVNFEIRGKVQGVHFRKYTQLKGTSFGLRGWCQNTNYSTVIGCMEGPHIKTEQMKQWLKSTGSPKSIITGSEFKETQIENYTLAPGFQIIK